MQKLALFLKNKAKPGKREEVHLLWDKLMTGKLLGIVDRRRGSRTI